MQGGFSVGQHVFTTTQEEARSLIIEDAHVYWGYPNNNYGGSDGFAICQSGGYVKFDLSSLPIDNILSANYSVHCKPDSCSSWHNFGYKETSNAWDEYTVTLNNGPGDISDWVGTNPLCGSTFGTNCGRMAELTTFFSQRLGVSSIHVIPTYCDPWGSVGSRESAPEYQPDLMITYMIPNTAPALAGTQASDGTPIGGNVTFTVYWTDNEGDDVVIYACKDDACENQWCNSTASTSPATCAARGSG